MICRRDTRARQSARKLPGAKQDPATAENKSGSYNRNPSRQDGPYDSAATANKRGMIVQDKAAPEQVKNIPNPSSAPGTIFFSAFWRKNAVNSRPAGTSGPGFSSAQTTRIKEESTQNHGGQNLFFYLVLNPFDQTGVCLMAKSKNPSAFTKEDHVHLIRAVVRYRQGEDSAMEEIYSLTWKYLLPYARKMATHQAVYQAGVPAVDEFLAEDLIEDTMVVVWKDIRTKLREPEKYCKWVLTILSNKFKNVYYKRDRLTYPSQSEEETGGWDTVVVGIGQSKSEFEELEDRMRLVSGLEHLKPAQQEVVYCTYLLDLREQDAAEILNIPLGTVKSRKKAGLAKLRKILPKEDS